MSTAKQKRIVASMQPFSISEDGKLSWFGIGRVDHLMSDKVEAVVAVLNDVVRTERRKAKNR